MTDKTWHGAVALGTLRAGDLISALGKVATARSRDDTSPLSGTMLYFPGGKDVVVWASDGTRFAQTGFALAVGGGEQARFLCVPSGYADALRGHVERADAIELGYQDPPTILARRSGEATTLLQPLWPADALIEAYNAFVAGTVPEAVATMRGQEVAERLRSIRDAGPITLDVSADAVSIRSSAGAGGAPVAIHGSLPAGEIFCDPAHLAQAIETVITVKLPGLSMVTFTDRELIRLSGLGRPPASSPGDVEYLLLTGSQHGRSVLAHAPGSTRVPTPASIVKPATVTPVEAVLAELDAIVGQTELKTQIRTLLNQTKINQRRKDQGLQASQLTRHMVFTGPPGTGKTTVARLIAQLYGALGILEHVDPVEVAKPDLVAPNVGGTEQKTTDAIDRAMDGVLFIDEAYTLAQGGDNDFGTQAIDVLLKRLEDDRDRFVCIVAGYTDQMKAFMGSNPGLRDRFSTSITFTPYSADELLSIAHGMARSSDNRFTPDGEAELSRRLADEQRRGGFERKDWGNARTMRKIIESAAGHRDTRISLTGADDIDSLVELRAEDVAAACDDLTIGRTTGGAESVADVLAEIDAQIGQPALKQQIRALLAQARLAQEREEAGLSAGGVQIEHLLFAGPPGTGKTTIARLIARLYRALGLLPNDAIVEVDRTALVGAHIGETEAKTRARIDDAIGGVLFIDEAYALARGGENDFGKEALDALVPRLENDRGKFLAIAAGYPDDMDALLAANDGLRSRFTTRIDFQPYTAAELLEIARSIAGHAGQTLDAEADAMLRDRLERAEQTGLFSTKAWGNGRSARNIVEGAMKDRDLRLSTNGYADPAEMLVISASDIEASCERYGVGTTSTGDESVDDVLRELERNIGQAAVKRQVRAIVDSVRAAAARRDAGIDDDGIVLEHLVFSGPPGTGKTTIARALARLYRALGVLPQGHLIETGRSDLVGAHVGETALKTRAKIDEAMGGILFIDEAYTLADGGHNDFGKEAVSELLTRLENDRGKFVTIVAGYTDQMQRFLDTNPGLRSRFREERIEFTAYDAEELATIAEAMITARRHDRLTTDAADALRRRLSVSERAGVFHADAWGNGRSIRTLVEESARRRDQRVIRSSDGSPTAADLVTITVADVEAAADALGLA